MARLASLLVLIALTSSARAQDDTPSPGQVLYAKDRAVWGTPADGSGSPHKLVTLDEDAGRVSRIEHARNGRFVLIEIAGKIAYAKLQEGKPAAVKPLAACDHGAQLSPDGLCIACIDGKGGVLVYVLATGKKRAFAGVAARELGFVSRTELVVAGKDDISTLALVASKPARKLAPQVPHAHLLVAPDGKRAVAIYRDGEREALYGFKLDGKAARRKLGSTGVPRAWSDDSRWVIVQADDHVCVVRAVGGEYKCWEGYDGLIMDPTSEHVLLARKKEKSARAYELFRAPIAGARAAVPKKIAEAEAPAGAWMP